MRKLVWSQVNAWRLEQHSLLARAKHAAMIEVVQRVGALQAQMMSAAELQLWARVENLTPDDVQNAIWQERTLLKSWVLRGTLHLIASADFPLYVAVLSAALLKFYRRPSWLRYHQVGDYETFEAITAAVDATLSDKPMSRKQLAEAIVERTGKPQLQAMLEAGWGMLLKPAAVQGFLCFAESEGQNVTFVHPREWIGAWKPVATEAAMREMARRYLNAYGPATADDFGHWYGMQPADAKKAFKLLGDEIEEVEVEGWKAWALTESKIEGAHSEKAVHLLPGFDPYVISASHHSEYLLADAHKAKVYRAQGWISPVVLVDGRIEGVWKYEKKKTHVNVTISPFAPLDKDAKRGVEAEAGRLGAYFDSEAGVTFEA